MKHWTTIDTRYYGIVCRERRMNGTINLVAIEYKNISAITYCIGKQDNVQFADQLASGYVARLFITPKYNRNKEYIIDVKIFDSEEEMLKSKVSMHIEKLMISIMNDNRKDRIHYVSSSYDFSYFT